jgi:Bacterial regulatory proteins, crp family
MKWLGVAPAESNAAYQRAREAGMSPFGGLVVGNVAGFRDAWLSRRTIAAHIGCAIRTVQRHLTRARAEGLIKVWHAKAKTEIPPGCTEPRPCGWSHRFTIGWGLAGEKVKQAVNAARASWLFRQAAPKKVEKTKALGSTVDPKRPARPEYQKRTWTAEQLEAELERLSRERDPPK